MDESLFRQIATQCHMIAESQSIHEERRLMHHLIARLLLLRSDPKSIERICVILGDLIYYSRSACQRSSLHGDEPWQITQIRKCLDEIHQFLGGESNAFCS